tara:strand:- start:37 stop:471 length:435 start_codon:yes stop_codon:yes gene_type:complete
MAGVKKQEMWYQLDLFSKEIRVPSEHDGYWHDHIWGIKKERMLAELKEKKEEKVDLVNHPPHYNKGGMEVIEVIELVTGGETGGETGGKRTGDQGFIGYLVGNIIKYLLRFEHKGNPVQDIEKAEWYLKLLKKKVKMLYGNKSV